MDRGAARRAPHPSTPGSASGDAALVPALLIPWLLLLLELLRLRWRELRLRARNPDLVVHLADARDVIGEVLGQALRPLLLHRALERHLAIRDADLDVARVERAVP